MSSPCPKSWDDLVGDNRIRYCGQCKLNVYNVADMAPSDVEQLVVRTEGRFCGRLYQRADQTVTVKNCPRAAFRKKIRAMLVASAALVLGGLAWMTSSSNGLDRSVYPDWVQTVLRWIKPIPQRDMVGKISCPPPKTPGTLPAVNED